MSKRITSSLLVGFLAGGLSSICFVAPIIGLSGIDALAKVDQAIADLTGLFILVLFPIGLLSILLAIITIPVAVYVVNTKVNQETDGLGAYWLPTLLTFGTGILVSLVAVEIARWLSNLLLESQNYNTPSIQNGWSFLLICGGLQLIPTALAAFISYVRQRQRNTSAAK